MAQSEFTDTEIDFLPVGHKPYRFGKQRSSYTFDTLKNSQQ